MPHTTYSCGVCKGLDLPQAIELSGTPEHDFFQRGQHCVYFVIEEGSCSQCNQPTRLVRTSFDDEQAESLHRLFDLAVHSVSHPVLPDYKATYFSIDSRFLLPKQARFVDAQSNDHTCLLCTRAVDSRSVDYDLFNDCIVSVVGVVQS